MLKVTSIKITEEQSRFLKETGFNMSGFARDKLSETDEIKEWKECQKKNM